MNMEITIVKTFCDFGHNVFKKQPLWPFFIGILAISYEKNLITLLCSTVATDVFFSLDLGFFGFIWGSGVFIENLFVF